VVYRHLKAGSVHAHVLRVAPLADASAPQFPL
jgi:hypothetical protein